MMHFDSSPFCEEASREPQCQGEGAERAAVAGIEGERGDWVLTCGHCKMKFAGW